MGTVRVLSGVANLASNSHFSNPSSFRDTMFFMIFFWKNFSKTLILKIPKRWRSQSCCCILWGYSQGFRILLLIMAAQIIVVFQIWRFYDFLRNFQKNLNVKKFQNFDELNHVIGICEGTLRGLRILPLEMTTQILVVFEIWRFFRIFQKT